jgi:hypothetical protein
MDTLHNELRLLFDEGCAPHESLSELGLRP